MRFLLTAFEPFDGTGLNASLEGCHLFLERWSSRPQGRPYGRFDVRFAVLPVEYGRDTKAVERALAEGPVDVVLHTGQASGSGEVRVERVALNLRYPDAALAGRALPQQAIEPNGPVGFLSTLPVDDVAAAIRAAGVPAVVSNHAGVYLCNHVLYQSLRRAAREGARMRVGFLHVPSLPRQVEEGAPAMEAMQIARAVEATLGFLSGSNSG